MLQGLGSPYPCHTPVVRLSMGQRARFHVPRWAPLSLSIIAAAGIAGASVVFNERGSVKWIVGMVLVLLVGAGALGSELARRQAVHDARFQVELVLDLAPEIPTLQDLDAHIVSVVREEREACLTSLSPSPPVPKPKKLPTKFSLADLEGPSYDDIESYQRRQREGETLTPVELGALAEFEQVGSKLSESLAGVIAEITFGPADKRTDQECRDEVDEYISRFRTSIDEIIMRQYRLNGLSLVALTLVNPTDRNFEKVKLELNASGRTSFVPELDDEDRPEIPTRPVPFGETQPIPEYSLGRPGALWNPFPVFDVPLEGVTINGGSCEFPLVALRPRGRVRLDVLHLIASDPVGSIIRLEWAATATNADGRVTGAMELQVSDQIDPDSLLRDAS
jgi:hypothetical protein